MNIIDLFSGCGGFSKGFLDEGFKIVGAIENFKPVAKTYIYNISDKVWVDDIKNIPPKAFESFINSNVDIIIGSPPCEPFTKANIMVKDNPLDRLYKDKRGRLVLYFIDYVRYFSEKNDNIIFIMENVPQIKEIKDELERLFGELGFDIYLNILRAEDYGNPSIRARAFISNIKLKPKKLNKFVVVEEALKNIPKNAKNHEIKKLSKDKLEKIKNLKFGEALYKYRGKSKLMHNWIRLNPKKLAPTVKGKTRFIHPYEDRLLTVREQARLMSYPDDFVFFGGREVQYNQIGESVPPVLSRAIAKYIKERL
ncbi:DNA cytosine methyltransferase [Methanocaldococcus villosus]|uniref:DNA cytosine methyltransferase n=1 Tax=Methanocaldococcus villosus TaxID=667126 RepID=UPI000362EFB5|nr:DNA cytosine methyltransferase [Methanocaldococcus villosus]